MKSFTLTFFFILFWLLCLGSYRKSTFRIWFSALGGVRGLDISDLGIVSSVQKV